ncbi:allergin-1 isoform 4-T5 [Cyanocitta cristata]
MLSNPKLVLVQGALNVVMKQNVTLSCLSESAFPPVRYTLFKHNQQVSALNRSDLTPALFTLTINSASDVGEYKCKAEYIISSGGKYSNSLNFTLIEKFKSTRPSTSFTSTVNAEESENEVIYTEIGNLEDPDLTENRHTTKF